MEENQRRKTDAPYQPENSQSSRKKAAPVRYFFSCYCSKSYSSFPALYLHCKNNHNRQIAYKNLKLVDTEWSGNVKYMHYEFEDGYEGGQERPEVSSNNQIPDDIIRRGPIPVPQDAPSVKRRQKKKTSTMMTSCDENILQIFEKYLSAMKQIQLGFLIHDSRRKLLQQLSQFMNREHREIQSESYQNYCLESTCKNVVLFFNSFYTGMQDKGTPLSSEEMQELNYLGKWLFFNKYSSECALLEEQYNSLFQN